jgi:hypothetical protein
MGEVPAYMTEVNRLISLIHSRFPYNLDISIDYDEDDDTYVIVNVGQRIGIRCEHNSYDVYVNYYDGERDGINDESYDNIEDVVETVLGLMEEGEFKYQYNLIRREYEMNILEKKIEEATTLQHEQLTLLHKMFVQDESDEYKSPEKEDDLLTLCREGVDLLKTVSEYQPGSSKVDDIKRHFESLSIGQSPTQDSKKI